jgi:hypothetical protein
MQVIISSRSLDLTSSTIAIKLIQKINVGTGEIGKQTLVDGSSYGIVGGMRLEVV